MYELVTDQGGRYEKTLVDDRRIPTLPRRLHGRGKRAIRRWRGSHAFTENGGEWPVGRASRNTGTGCRHTSADATGTNTGSRGEPARQGQRPGDRPRRPPRSHALLLRPERGGRIVCSGACTTYWPPSYSATGNPAAGAGVIGRLTVIMRGGGDQLVYNNWPLYTFAGDSAAGQTNGQGVVGFGGKWLVATPSLRP